MIQRILTKTLLESLLEFPIVGLVGSRQVGKTTLSQQIARLKSTQTVMLDLERPSDLARIADAEFFLEQYREKLVILDEVQRKPELFPVLRALVDLDRRPGRFLLLGSSAPDLIRQSSESLAGRIIYHELTPLSLQETGSRKWKQLWVRGGFPESFLAPLDAKSMNWRNAFIGTYLERDLPQLGVRIPSVLLRRFWEMLAHSQGQLWNASKVAAGLGVTAPTARHYLDLLHDTFIVRQLQPYFPNVKKRLVKSPKVYLRDSGLLHALLGLPSFNDILGHPVAGGSWEGWVIEQILDVLPPDIQPFFYRTHAGTEVDLVLARSGKVLAAIEIKMTTAPQITRGLREALVDLKCDKGFLVHPGKTADAIAPGIWTIPIDSLSMLAKRI